MGVERTMTPGGCCDEFQPAVPRSMMCVVGLCGIKTAEEWVKLGAELLGAPIRLSTEKYFEVLGLLVQET